LRTIQVQKIDEDELVLEGNDFDFGELDWVQQGIIPKANLVEIEVINCNSGDDSAKS
jgi:hypothetical protein